MAAGKKLTAVLEVRSNKKNSVKFSTNDPNGESPDNTYVPNAGMEKIGNPDKVKITVEPA